MPTNSFLPRLVFLALCALDGCSPVAAPVLQIDITAGLPMETGKIDIILTTADGKLGSAAFLKDGTNHFTVTPPTATSPMPTTSVAVDLPVGTSGVVQVRVEVRSTMQSADMGTMSADMGTTAGPPAPPAAEASGCAAATIVPGTLTKLAMMLMMPAQPCAP